MRCSEGMRQGGGGWRVARLVMAGQRMEGWEKVGCAGRVGVEG